MQEDYLNYLQNAFLETFVEMKPSTDLPEYNINRVVDMLKFELSTKAESKKKYATRIAGQQTEGLEQTAIDKQVKIYGMIHDEALLLETARRAVSFLSLYAQMLTVECTALRKENFITQRNNQILSEFIHSDSEFINILMQTVQQKQKSDKNYKIKIL